MAVVALRNVQWPPIVMRPLVCRRKVGYATKQLAQNRAGVINRTRGIKSGRLKVKPWLCEFCGYYHIGKREQEGWQ